MPQPRWTNPEWMEIYEGIKKTIYETGEWSASTLGYRLCIETEREYLKRHPEENHHE